MPYDFDSGRIHKPLEAAIKAHGLTGTAKAIERATGTRTQRQKVFNWRRAGRVPAWAESAVEELAE